MDAMNKFIHRRWSGFRRHGKEGHETNIQKDREVWIRETYKQAKWLN